MVGAYIDTTILFFDPPYLLKVSTVIPNFLLYLGRALLKERRAEPSLADLGMEELGRMKKKRPIMG